MIPLGVEASIATATAVDAAAPSGFLDGLLAVLNAGTAATTLEPDQPATVVTTANLVTSTVKAPTAEAAVASFSCPCCARGATPATPTAPDPHPALDLTPMAQIAPVVDVSAVASIASPEPIADLTVAAAQTDDDQPIELSALSATTGQPVWSVSAYPGGPETLHNTAVESSEPPRWVRNTPQHRRSTDSGEGAVVAESAMATALEATVVTATTSTPKDAVAKNAGGKIVTSRNAAVDGTPLDTARTDVAQAGDVKVDAAQAVAAQSTATSLPADPAAANASVQRPSRQLMSLDSPQLLRESRAPSASAAALVDAGIGRLPNEPEHRDGGPARVPAGLSAVRSIVTDRAEPAPTVATGPPPVPKVAATTSPTIATRASAPASLGMIGVDRVRFAREQAPSRAVQRLAIDLDGAQVAVRFAGDRVAVDVLNDPTGSLGNGWARQVERSLDQAARTVSEPQRGGQSTDQRGSQPSGSGRRGAGAHDGSDEGQPRSTRPFTLFPEEED